MIKDDLFDIGSETMKLGQNPTRARERAQTPWYRYDDNEGALNEPKGYQLAALRPGHPTIPGSRQDACNGTWGAAGCYYCSVGTASGSLVRRRNGVLTASGAGQVWSIRVTAYKASHTSASSL